MLKLGIQIIGFLLIICFGLDIYGQQYSYVQYSDLTDAPFDQVNSVVQDKEGFMWIGTKSGLFRFDGIHFDTYSQHTKSQTIHQLHSIGDKILFVNDVGVYRVENLSTAPLVSPVIEGSIIETDEKPFYPNDFIQAIDSTLWISQSNHSIAKLSNGDFKVYPFTKSEQAQHFTIQIDQDNVPWVLSPLDGLFRYDENTDQFESKLSSDQRSTFLIHKNHLILGGSNVKIYSLKNNKPQLLRTIKLENDQVNALVSDPEKGYIIGTKTGKLLKLETINSQPETIYGGNEAHRVEALDFGSINEIYITRDSLCNSQKIWVSSETGLWLLQERFFKTVDDLPMNNPIAISMANNGNVFTPINYLYKITPKEDGFKALPIYDNLQANAVASDKNGYTWVTTSTPKVELHKYFGNSILKKYDFHDRGESIFNLFPDSNGNIWFCQAPSYKPIIGLAKINTEGKVLIYDETKGFSSRILSIKQSNKGELYAVGIGEESYLYKYNPEQDHFKNISPTLPFETKLNFEAHDLTIDNRGVVWLATTDGLLQYDAEKITRIENDILDDSEVRGVTHYPNNAIWISTATKGLVYHHENVSTILGELSGLPAEISAYRCITTDQTGRIWAGTAEGLVYSRIAANTLPNSNPPRIIELSLDSKILDNSDDTLIQIRSGQSLSITFSNLFYPAKDVFYEYKLIASKDEEWLLDEQIWIPFEKQNALNFPELDKGDFSLYIRAKQPGGYQWSTPMKTQISVTIPWYLNSWFVYLSSILVVFGIGYYFRFYVKRRFRRLQEVLKFANEKLAQKEAQLSQKIQEFEVQQEELENANLNIQTLEMFINKIPEYATWNDIIAAMGKAVNQSSDIDAFEIAFKDKGEIIHRGYSNQEKGGFTFRSKPFNPKTSLTSFAMANNKEVFINDFENEHGMYVQEKDAYLFNSLLFIPFELDNKQPVVLCAYSTEKHHFDSNDLTMFRILARFIYFSIHQEISKVT